MTLPKSQVRFDQDTHTYTTPEGKTLSGVTALLQRTLFPDMYVGIDDDILERAKQRGTTIHEKIEMYETMDAYFDDPDIIRYRETLESALSGYKTLATEYLISDNLSIASSIDTIYVNDKDIIISDIKTTHELHTDYVAWQLSIYAYLFNLQTGLTPSRAMVMWLPKNGKARMITLKLYSYDDVQALIHADSIGAEFTPPDNPNNIEYLYASDPLILRYIALLDKKKAIEAKIEELRPEVTDTLRDAYNSGCFSMSFLDENGNKSCSLSFSPSSTRTSFDSKAFAEEYPELYQQYLRKTNTKETIRFTTKQ